MFSSRCVATYGSGAGDDVNIDVHTLRLDEIHYGLIYYYKHPTYRRICQGFMNLFILCKLLVLIVSFSSVISRVKLKTWIFFFLKAAQATLCVSLKLRSGSGRVLLEFPVAILSSLYH